MCTVTFIARENGYALGMNRDEKLSRVQGLPPSKYSLNGRMALFPSEPGGGTWIGVNDAGVTFALLNWYAVPSRVSKNPISRGKFTRSMLPFTEASEAQEHLGGFPLENTNPFRLIGVFPQNPSVVEWRWNLSSLQPVVHDWRTSIWISSGFDEPGAQCTRRQAFLQALQTNETDLKWLRELHSSHTPSSGPYSVCMHRSDAASVSYTEIEVDDASSRLAYIGCSPCHHQRGGWIAANAQVIPRLRATEGANRCSDIRKFALTGHVTASVGWFGAVPPSSPSPLDGRVRIRKRFRPLISR